MILIIVPLDQTWFCTPASQTKIFEISKIQQLSRNTRSSWHGQCLWHSSLDWPINCFSTFQLTKTLQKNPNEKNYNHNRKNFLQFPAAKILSGKMFIWTTLKWNTVAHAKFTEDFALVPSLFILNCISSIPTVRFCYFFWKEMRNTSIEELSLGIET